MVELFKEFFIENYYKNKIDFIPRYFLFNPLYPEYDINKRRMNDNQNNKYL